MVCLNTCNGVAKFHQRCMTDWHCPGFAVRGNPDDETEKRQGMEAEEQAIKWFQKHLTNRSKL